MPCFPDISVLTLPGYGEFQVTDFISLKYLKKFKVDSLQANSVSITIVCKSVTELTIFNQKANSMHLLPQVLENSFPSLEFIYLKTDQWNFPIHTTNFFLPQNCIAVETQFKLLPCFLKSPSIQFLRIFSRCSEYFSLAFPIISELICDLRILVYECAWMPPNILETIIAVLKIQTKLEVLCLSTCYNNGFCDRIKPLTNDHFGIIKKHAIKCMIIGKYVAYVDQSLSEQTISCLNYIDEELNWRTRKQFKDNSSVSLAKKEFSVDKNAEIFGNAIPHDDRETTVQNTLQRNDQNNSPKNVNRVAIFNNNLSFKSIFFYCY